mgnify:CR=1 FL=1
MYVLRRVGVTAAAPICWPVREDLAPCPECNPKGDAGTCGLWECDLCSYGDCDECGGLGWVDEDLP